MEYNQMLGRTRHKQLECSIVKMSMTMNNDNYNGNQSYNDHKTKELDCEVLVGAGHLLLPRVSYFFRSNHQTTAGKSGYREGYLKISEQFIIVIAR